MTQKTPIEVLDFMIENYSGINGVYHEVYDALEEAKERILALPIQQSNVGNHSSEWIDVRDRLPETYDNVFTNQGIAFYDKQKNKWYMDFNGDYKSINPTHWQPLPNPPITNN